jgi:hypothetical protein
VRIISRMRSLTGLIRERCAGYCELYSCACHLIGIHPVAVEDRTETHFIKIFFIWMSANMNILSCVFFSLNRLRKSAYTLALS